MEVLVFIAVQLKRFSAKPVHALTLKMVRGESKNDSIKE